MEKIKKTYNTIEKVLDKNRRITMITVFSSAIVTLIMGCLIYQTSKHNLLAVDKDGDIVSLTRATESELMIVEAENHIRLFYDRFFNYNKSNYKERVESALHLTGKSGKRLYETYRLKNWYNNVINNDLILTTKIVKDVQFHYSKGKLTFKVYAVQRISAGNIAEYRHLDIRGRIIKASNGRIRKLNPHGMLIENIVITNNSKCDDEYEKEIQF